jgi:hypothetical protein
MGGCCYTPRRTQILWWYWLLLASVVGIPMLIACWYVERHRGQEDQAQLGRQAARLFWGGTAAMALVITIVSYQVAGAFASNVAVVETLNPFLMFGFVAGLGGFTHLARHAGRLIAVLFWLVVLAIGSVVYYEPPSLPDLLWQMATCAAVAQFLVRFTASPNQQTARAALAALVVGAFLFWGAAKYGRWANHALWRLAHGRAGEIQMNLDPYD